MRHAFDLDRPIYLQIIEDFKRAVARGELAPGDRIPSQRELAQQIRVNPNTVQRAYREMETMGLIETHRGQGSFVGRDPEMLRRLREEMAAGAVGRYIREMRELGFPDGEILARVAAALQAPGDSSPEEG